MQQREEQTDLPHGWPDDMAIKVGDICQINKRLVGKITKIIYCDQDMVRALVEVVLESNQLATITVTLNEAAIQNWQQPTIH